MNFKKTLFGLLLFAITSVYAQVKIGDNPNSIDPSSIVELESTDKAFVLTRVSDAQMQSISPLRGAMVYNTDTQCVHYFDGTNWSNLCEGGTSGFTLTNNGNGTYTLSDGKGMSVILNTAPETITTLVDNADGSFTYTNESGITTTITNSNSDDQNLTGATLNTTTNQLQIDIEDGASVSADLSTLDQSADVAANTATLNAHIAADLDQDPDNEYNSGIALTGTSIEVIDAGGTLSQDLDGTFATDAELAALSVDDADADPLNELNTSVVLNGTDLETTDVGGTITTDLSSLVDDADADANNELNTGIALSGTAIEVTDTGGTLSQDLDGTFATDAELAALSVDDADADPLNELNTSVVLNGTDLETTDAGGTITTDLSSLVDDADADANNELNTGIALSG
ncbi:MAG: hypothetical protein WBN59_05080, partial [Flavobacteriaceae bacterium]